MFRSISTILIFVLLFGTAAYADSVSNFTLTQISIFVLPNDGTGDNVGFTFAGNGTSITGGGTFTCFDWCSFQGFAPGSTPPLDLGQLFPSGQPNMVMIGGTVYDPQTFLYNSPFFANALGSFTFPNNPSGSNFTACVPAGTSSSLQGFVGSGLTFLEFNLLFPASGQFCATWNFDSSAGVYTFLNGQYTATAIATVPEPCSLGLMGTGLMAIIAASWGRWKSRRAA